MISYEVSIMELLEGDTPRKKYEYLKQLLENPKQTLPEKAIQWIASGNIGARSMTMWNCLIGNTNFGRSSPSDPGDFGRCYRLLEFVPEWKSEIYKLKSLSKRWSVLIDNWDELTKMYKLCTQYPSEKGYWESMYKFMKELFEGV